MRLRVMIAQCLLVTACGSKAPAAHSSGSPPTAVPDAKTLRGSDGQAEPAEAKVGVAVQVTPNDAEVSIDDLVVGKASQLDPVFALAPGLHTLVVTDAGYKTYRMEFTVTDKTETFTIHLDKK